MATVGFAAGLDGGTFRTLGALLLLGMGLVLLAPAMQARLATAAGPIGDWTEQRFGGLAGAGLPGQFGIGVLLGAVWSPCVGPTLGAASVMAARGENLGMVAATMLAFGLGVGLPLAALGLASRELMQRWRGRVLAAGSRGKQVLGGFLVARRLPRPLRARQAAGGHPRRRLAGLAHQPDDAVLSFGRAGQRSRRAPRLSRPAGRCA